MFADFGKAERSERRLHEALVGAILCAAKKSGIKRDELPIIQEADFGKAERSERRPHEALVGAILCAAKKSGIKRDELPIIQEADFGKASSLPSRFRYIMLLITLLTQGSLPYFPKSELTTRYAIIINIAVSAIE